MYFHYTFVYERIIIVDYLRKLDIVTSGVVIAALRFCHLTMISTARTARSASSVQSSMDPFEENYSNPKLVFIGINLI